MIKKYLEKYKQKSRGKIIFVVVLKVTDEKSRIRCRIRIR
jgi:hypothetical protein